MENHETLTTNLSNNFEESMKWKYAMIAINHNSVPRDYCELVEVFFGKDDSAPVGFSKARICSIQELNAAYEDISVDGVNMFFVENGIFERDIDDDFWIWTPTLSGETYEDDELYAIYGGD